MKNWILILLPVLLLGLGGCQKAEHAGHDEDTEYTCSMHPQIRQKKPGNCPICGMHLVPVPKTQAVTPAADPAGASKEEAAPSVQLMPA